MKIYGMEKLSLLDYEGKLACTLWTAKCNFRCPFCHNAPLVSGAPLPEEIAEDEIFSYLNKRKGILSGVCITGGEPTINADLLDFLQKIKDIGYDVKLDTNGTNPEMVKRIIDSKVVDYIAMDIKNSPNKYNLTCGITVDMSKIRQSIDIIKSAPNYEFRTTLIDELHDLDDAAEIGKLTGKSDVFFLQKFVERDTCLTQSLTEVSEEKAKRIAEIIKEYTKGNVSLRGY